MAQAISSLPSLTELGLLGHPRQLLPASWWLSVVTASPSPSPPSPPLSPSSPSSSFFPDFGYFASAREWLPSRKRLAISPEPVLKADSQENANDDAMQDQPPTDCTAANSVEERPRAPPVQAPSDSERERDGNDSSSLQRALRQHGAQQLPNKDTRRAEGADANRASNGPDDGDNSDGDSDNDGGLGADPPLQPYTALALPIRCLLPPHCILPLPAPAPGPYRARHRRSLCISGRPSVLATAEQAYLSRLLARTGRGGDGQKEAAQHGDAASPCTAATATSVQANSKRKREAVPPVPMSMAMLCENGGGQYPPPALYVPYKFDRVDQLGGRRRGLRARGGGGGSAAEAAERLSERT